MNNTIHLIDVSERTNASLVFHLQQLSYLEESKIIEYPNLPPLLESIDDLMTSKETFIGFYQDAQLLGVISCLVRHDTLEIGRLIVRPRFFRKGIAKELLKYIESFQTQIRILKVSTAQKNLPAIKLYQNQGYHQKNVEQLHDGLMIVHLEKDIKLTRKF